MFPVSASAEPTTTAVRVAGVDGCPGGWSVAIWDGGTLRLERHETLTELVGLARDGALDLVAIDMPMGLLDTDRRAGDAELRRRLGPRRASLFPPPVRVVLEAADYDEARAGSRSVCGRAPSIQAWNLVPKIAELDALLTPADQTVVVEAHPELAFARLGGSPRPDAKSTPAGRADRRLLLDERFGAAVVECALRDRRVPIIDALDSIVLCDLAERVVGGDAEAVGWQRDARGLRATVWV